MAGGKTDKYRTGIIGCGRMAWLFDEDKLISRPITHLSAYSAHKKTEVIAVCDQDAGKLTAVSRKFNIKRCYRDYNEMLECERLDIVSICTPAPSHADMCKKAAGSGVKAIFCEKPIATSIKEARDMVSVCDKNNVILAVNHTKRWDSAFEKIKHMLDRGVLGRINMVNAFATAGLFNSGTHIFDLLRYYFGDVESVCGVIIPDRSTDPGARGAIRFKNGLSCFFDSCWREYLLFGIDIYGEKGMLKSNNAIRSRKAFDLFVKRRSDKETGINELRRTDYWTPRWTSPILRAVTNIVDSIEKGEEVVCSGRDGLAAIEIALAFHESQGKRIELPLKNSARKVIPRQTSFTKDGKLR